MARGRSPVQMVRMPYVLLVDDDLDAREAVTRYLQKRGHRVACASNGREAIRALVESPIPDAVVLDARMPEMDGVSFLEVIRCYLRWQSLPVFMLTAFAEGTHIRRASQLGVQKIFLKANFDLQELVQNIEAYSGMQSAAGLPNSSKEPQVFPGPAGTIN
jgi:CheY-like chemotaxis protein